MFDLMVNSPVSSSKVAFFFSGLLDFIRYSFKKDHCAVYMVFGPNLYDDILELSRRTGMPFEDLVSHVVFLGIDKVKEVFSDD